MSVSSLLWKIAFKTELLSNAHEYYRIIVYYSNSNLHNLIASNLYKKTVNIDIVRNYVSVHTVATKESGGQSILRTTMMAIPAVVRQSGKNWSWNQTKKQKDINITESKTVGDFEMTMGQHNLWNINDTIIKRNNNFALLCIGDKIGCFINWSQHNSNTLILKGLHKSIPLSV